MIIKIYNLSCKNFHVGEPRKATAQIYLPVLILQLFMGEGLFPLIFKQIRTKNMSCPPQG